MDLGTALSVSGDADAALAVLTEATTAHRSGDAAAVTRWLTFAAELGCVAAMFALGLNADYGEGDERQAVVANCWYRMAADAGHTDAMQNLSINLNNGDGATKEDAGALALWESAAECGVAEAMCRVGRSALASRRATSAQCSVSPRPPIWGTRTLSDSCT